MGGSRTRGTSLRDLNWETEAQSLRDEIGRCPSVPAPHENDKDVRLAESQPSKMNVVHDISEQTTLEKENFGAQSIVLDASISGSKSRRIEGEMGRLNACKPISFGRFRLLWMQQYHETIAPRTKLLYKAVWRLVGRDEILPTQDGRHIVLDASRAVPLIDERTSKEYIDNTVRSSRYTIWNFLPLQLWFQFSKVANFYFLIVGIMQLIPGLSTTGTYTTILPLLFFLSFSIGREGYDDFRRSRLDKVENRRPVHVLYGYRPGGVEGQMPRSFLEMAQKSWNCVKRKLTTLGKKNITETPSIFPQSGKSSEITQATESDDIGPCPWGTVKWMNLKVGDIIELRRDDAVPADIVLLYANGRDGLAYVETMALDGETNLKTKQPLRLIAESCETLTDISECGAAFVVEDPNLDLYHFNGKVTLNGKTLPLTLSNMICRGSTLRNTARAVGMVINTGEECKIRLNASRKTKAKAPAIQAMTNRVVIILTIFLILLSVGCTAGYEIWTVVFEDRAWYLAGSHLPLDDIFIAFVIEFNNLIPLALYVSLEIIKFAQFLLLHDIEMYDPESNTPMVSNTQTIYENLGQVNYIFSDKTGTLTENVMGFRKMSVAGTAWLHSGAIFKDPVRRRSKHGEIRTMTNEKMAESNRQNETPLPVITEVTAVYSSSPRDALPKALPGAPLTRPQVIPPDSQQELSTAELVQCLRCNPNTLFAQKVQFFLLSLALCHTCFPEIEKGGEIRYQATSPDELAIVEAAQDMGYTVIDRMAHSVTLLTYPLGSDSAVRETYEVLDLIEFSTKRKRMSTIVRFPDGRICLYCKGADSVIQPRLKLASLAFEKVVQVERRNARRVAEDVEGELLRKGGEQQQGLRFHRSSLDHKTLHVPMESNQRRSLQSEQRASKHDQLHELTHGSQLLDDGNVFEHCFQHLHDFSTEGLRTLLFGYRFLDEEEYTSWKKIHHHASTSLVNRQEMIESAGEIIERDLELAGATAIEDKLQWGVPETIEKLQRANIKIWMLTGDKRETAINIAHSTGICKSYSRIIIVDKNSEIEMTQQIASAFLEVTEGNIPHSVIVVDGQTLVRIERDAELPTLFYELLLTVDSVICCRASPSQKATMVKTIRNKVPGSMTLAIGDGGNDIAMIQEAHVGVGISGKEGLQAARVADYSIAQFRFLQRILFVHGHWNYVRTSKYILFTFWKEMMFYSIQVLYQRWNGYTGTSLYESDSLAVWNTLFTSLPVMLPGIFEQDLSAATLLAVPELYSYGQECRGFNMKKYTLWMILAGCQAVIIYFMVYGLYSVVPITEDQGIFAIGDLAFSVCVVFINVKLLVLQYHYKTWIPIFGAILTIFGWWAWNLFLSAIYYKSPGPYVVYHGFTEHFGKSPTWWAVLVSVLVVLVVIELGIDAVQRRFWPSLIDIWQELEQDERIKRKLEESGVDGGYGVGFREGMLR